MNHAHLLFFLMITFVSLSLGCSSDVVDKGLDDDAAPFVESEERSRNDVGFNDVGKLDPDAGGDAAQSDAEADAEDDQGPPLQACDCRPGLYQVDGEGMGDAGLPFSVSYVLEVTESCGGEPVCTLDDTDRRCGFLLGQAGGFRVYLDGQGYVQLVMSGNPCDEPWTGSYVTQGGSAEVEARRFP